MIKEVDDNYPDIKEVWIFNINEDPQANEEYSFKVRLRYSSSVHTSESLLKIFDEAKIMRLNINYESNDGEETSLKTLDEFAKKIYDLKPGYIFAFDENQLLAGFCKQFTDVLTVKREDDLKDYFNLDKEVKK